jgi:hypothetical protein
VLVEQLLCHKPPHLTALRHTVCDGRHVMDAAVEPADGRLFTSLQERVEAALGQARVGVQSLTINYARVITNVAGAAVSDTPADWSETGESSDNTNAGLLYGTVAANGSNWDISLYSDASKPTASLVAKATNIAASAVFTATARNRSGLTVIGKMAAGPAAGNTFTVDLKVFSTDGRADGAPDRFTFLVTLASIGAWQEEIAELYHYYGESDAAASETVYDYWIERHGDLLIP